MPDDTAVRFRSVSKHFGSVTAVDQLDLHLHCGETVALLGPNGAGKSTSLSMLLGLLEPDQGQVSLFGGPPRAAVTAGRVGAMLQTGGCRPAPPSGSCCASSTRCTRTHSTPAKCSP